MGWKTEKDSAILEISSPQVVGEMMAKHGNDMDGTEFLEMVQLVGFIFSVSGQSQQTSGFLAIKMGVLPAVEYQLAHTRMLKYAVDRVWELADKYKFGDEARKAVNPPAHFDEIIEGLEDMKKDIAEGHKPQIVAASVGFGKTEKEADAMRAERESAQLPPSSTRH